MGGERWMRQGIINLCINYEMIYLNIVDGESHIDNEQTIPDDSLDPPPGGGLL